MAHGFIRLFSGRSIVVSCSISVFLFKILGFYGVTDVLGVGHTAQTGKSRGRNNHIRFRCSV